MPLNLAHLQDALARPPLTLPARYDDLTPAERVLVTKEYRFRQHDLCHHCNAPLDGPPWDKVAAMPVNETKFPEGFFERPIHLHHSHVTGLTIGAVHAHCNAVLWEYFGE